MLQRILCGVYSFMLFAYPRDFRDRYGKEMRQLFRDRLRAGQLRKVLPQTLVDWISSASRERFVPARLARTAAEWAAVVLAYFFITTTLVQAYVVPTGSMEATIKPGDHMLVDRLAAPYREIARGDVIAFRYPEDPRVTYIKRVIGLPGDRIRLSEKRVIRNEQLLREPYVQHNDSRFDAYRDNFPNSPAVGVTARGRNMLNEQLVSGVIVVPPNAFFVLGDNRDNSLDSRYWGFVPRANIVGKPLFVYWSYDGPPEWSVSHFQDLALHFFSKTRWDRTFYSPGREDAEPVTEERPDPDR